VILEDVVAVALLVERQRVLEAEQPPPRDSDAQTGPARRALPGEELADLPAAMSVIVTIRERL